MKIIGKQKSILMFLVIIISAMFFVLSYSYIAGNNKPHEPEITITTTPTNATMTWYTSMPLIHAERIANAFSTDTGIDVKIVRNSTFIIREHLMSDIENGESKADVLTIADVGTYIELKSKGHLMEYASPHYEYYSDEYKDQNYWGTVAAFGICMAYDDSRISDPPQQWTDLLDERWNGRIGLEDINTAGSQYGQYYILRERLGVQFWETLLSSQEPKIYYRTEELANALLDGEIDVAGEFSIHTVYSYRIKKGTSIHGIYPEEGIPMVLNPIAIMNGTKHPNEAKMFMDFLLSKDGQELVQRLSYKYSVHDDVLSLEGEPPFSKLNALNPENETDYRDKRSEYILEFNHFMGENK
ncbi:MAG: extracellular solute-binding protein [ANME-2 cluster archaeon]|nr:extracellular solute-binding protein [ANME-2 cluster archaeon]